ncbi:MAG: oligosaccharide flippase family protein [Promethearchaeota archaeon]
MNKNKEDNIYIDDIHLLIRKNSYYMLLERFTVPVINFLITIYIIRKLSIDEFGIYNILLAIMSYVGLVSSLGLPNVFQRFIPEFYQKKQIGKLRNIVNKGLLYRFVICFLIILIILIFSDKIGFLLKFGEALNYLIIFSVAIIFHLESGLLSSTLTSVFNHKNYVIAQIIYVLFRACLIYYLLRIVEGLVGLLIAESTAFGLLFFIQFVYYRKFLGSQSNNNDTETKLPLQRLLKFGGYSYLNEAGSRILSVSTDFFIISAFLGPAAVGIYAFANRILKIASHVLPHSMLINVIRPVFFTKYIQDEDPNQINKMFNFIMKFICFFTLPLVTGIILLGDKLIIYVFDIKYIESLIVLWVVAVFVALDFFWDPVGLVLQSIEKVKILFFSKIFAIYNIVADILVVKSYGVVGIALVTGSAVLFKNIFCYFFAKKYIHLSIDIKGISKIVFNSLLMGILLYPIKSMIVNIYTFILVILFGLIIYFLISYFNIAFSEEEKKVINKIMPKPIFSF